MEEDQLLDPTQVTKTGRPLQSCAVCHKVLWCVRGAFHVDLAGNHKWESICVNCYRGLQDQGYGVEDKDERLVRPPCPHLEGFDEWRGSCAAACPHSHDYVWGKLEQRGEERLEQYRDRVRSMGGQNPRQIAGQTVDDIVSYFK